jgi:predicted RNase H-like nuclease
MRHRILEIESLAVADERIVEVHPEVSFRELFGQPLSKKRDATGLAERNLALIRAGITLPELPFPADDVYDATVAAWSAMRYAQRKALPLPEGTATVSARSGVKERRARGPSPTKPCASP